MRRIFVPLLGEAGDRSALDTASALLAGGGGHVDVQLLRRDPRDVLPLVGEGFGAAMIDDVLRAAESSAQEREETARKAFDEWAAASGASVDAAPGSGGLTTAWTVTVGPIPGTERDPARVADAVVCARGIKDGSPDRAALIEVAVMDSGRPVILPADGEVKTVGSTVLVAWNGSAEAARAVSMSMPLLARAKRAVVVTVDDGDVTAEPGALAETLRSNGIEADGVTVSMDRAGVAATLEIEAKKQGADLILLGAYSHSRVREFIMGGVTDDALTEGSVAMMLAR
jgi:nucleotide-binding universal stress UspA family protein